MHVPSALLAATFATHGMVDRYLRRRGVAAIVEIGAQAKTRLPSTAELSAASQ